MRGFRKPSAIQVGGTLAVAAIVSAGLLTLLFTHAATPFIAIEPENGTIKAPAVKASDTTASGSAAVAFKSAPMQLKPAKLMPLGDSITNGYDVPGGYRILLWEKLVQDDKYPIDFVGTQSNGPAELGDHDHEGHSGWCIDGPCRGAATTLMGSIDSWLTKGKPDIIILSIGTNDIGLGASASTVTTRLDTLIARIFTDMPNTHLVLAEIISMNNPSEDAVRTTYNNSMPGLVNKYQQQGRHIALVDNSNLLHNPADYYVAGGWHPNRQGYDKMANSFYNVVQPLYLSMQ